MLINIITFRFSLRVWIRPCRLVEQINFSSWVAEFHFELVDVIGLKFIGFNELGAVAQYDYKQIISQSSKSHHLAVISNPNSLQYFLPHRASNTSTEELKVWEAYMKCLPGAQLAENTHTDLYKNEPYLETRVSLTAEGQTLLTCTSECSY